MVEFTPVVVDISHYEEITTEGFQQAKDDGIIGMICKASQGTNYKDPMYDDFREDALAAGLLWGAYHFNSGENVTRQVDWFLECAKPDDKTLVALDYETNERKRGVDMSIHQAVEWLRLIEKRLKRKAVIYSGNKLKETIGRLNDEDFDYIKSHRLWLAQYSSKYSLPEGFDNFWIWQYTGDGRGPEPHWVSGIKCPGNKGIDLNVTELSNDDLIKTWAS